MDNNNTVMNSPIAGPGSAVHSQKPSSPIDKIIGYGTYGNRHRAAAVAANRLRKYRGGGDDDYDDDDRSSELSDSGHFLAKGAFLITPSNELNLEKATAICEKMNYKGPYSVTRTATGILFKFAEQDDYHVTFRKGFHKVTNSRFYKKVHYYCAQTKNDVDKRMYIYRS